MAASRKVVITCAVTGAIHTPSMSPHLPVTPDEIAAAGIAAAKLDIGDAIGGALLVQRLSTRALIIVVVLSLPRGTGAAPAGATGVAVETGPVPGWGVVLRDRTLLRVTAISILVFGMKSTWYSAILL